MKNKYIFMQEAGDGTQGSGGGTSGDEVAFGAEGYKYAGKFESPETLEKGYSDSVAMHTTKMEEMNEKLKGFVGAPEGGEYVIPEGANTYPALVMESLSKWGEEQGLSQEAYSSLLGSIAEAETTNSEAFKVEQMSILGHNAEARIQNINDKWTAKYGEKGTEWMNSKAINAEDVEMFESLLSDGSDSIVNPDGTLPQGAVIITQDQLSEAMFKKDSAGMILMQTSPEYKKLVDEMTVKYNKQRGTD